MNKIIFQIILQAEAGQYNYDIKWKELFLADSFAIKWKCSPNIVCIHHDYAGLSLTPVPLLPGSCHPHRGHAILIKVQDKFYYFLNGNSYKELNLRKSPGDDSCGVWGDWDHITCCVIICCAHVWERGTSWRRDVTEFRYIAVWLGRAGAAHTNGHGYQKHSLSLTYSILDLIGTEQLLCY